MHAQNRPDQPRLVAELEIQLPQRFGVIGNLLLQLALQGFAQWRVAQRIPARVRFHSHCQSAAVMTRPAASMLAGPNRCPVLSWFAVDLPKIFAAALWQG